MIIEPTWKFRKELLGREKNLLMVLRYSVCLHMGDWQKPVNRTLGNHVSGFLSYLLLSFPF